MNANLSVAQPAHVAIARDKPQEQQPSGDDRFSNLLSQRQTRDDAPSAQHASTSKPKTSDSAKSKEKDAKPNDTLHLLQNSAAIQPTVTSSPQSDQSAQPAAETIDDVLSKSATNPVAQSLVASVVQVPVTDAGASDSTSTSTTTDAALNAISQSTTSTAAAATPAAGMAALIKTLSPVSTAATADHSNAAIPRAASSSQRAFVPATLSADAPNVTSSQTAETPAATSPTTPSSATAAASNDAPAVNLEAAKPTTIAIAQQPAILATQLDFSNAAPTIVATAIAAATTHRAASHDDAPDDSLDSIDTTTSTSATPTLSLPEQRDIATVDGKTPVPAPSSPQFGDALGAKLTWMAERHIGHAEIRLAPDDLGTVDVRVRLNGEHVRAEFASTNSDVRQAITDHLPRLRDMLSQHGFNLSESHVGNGSSQQSAQAKPEDTASSAVKEDVALPEPRISAYTHDGILDAFV